MPPCRATGDFKAGFGDGEGLGNQGDDGFIRAAVLGHGTDFHHQFARVVHALDALHPRFGRDFEGEAAGCNEHFFCFFHAVRYITRFI